MTSSESTPASIPESAVKTVFYRKRGADGASGRVSVRTFKEMITRWEIGPDDFIRVEGDPSERRVREYPVLSPLDEMLHEVSTKSMEIQRGLGRRSAVIRELEMLLEYAEYNDRVYSVACLLLGWLRYAENPALARGLFLRALERGYPVPSIARNNLAVAQIRLGDPAGRDNLILAANDPQRPPAALINLARILQHLQALGERTEEIASVKDLMRVARAEWRRAAATPGESTRLALFLCDGDIPTSFASEARSLTKAQGHIEDILAEGEDCLRQGRLEQALAHSARAAAEMDRVHAELASAGAEQGVSPLRFLSVRLSRLEKGAHEAKKARENQGQLEVFRRRLRTIEESLQLKVPPADIIQQAEILMDSARSEGERAEAGNLLRQCQDRVGHHLLDTANELLSAGEKEVAIGLLRRALALHPREADEIKLRLAGIRREELEEEIARAIASESFEEARAKIALLRTLHPIFEPVASRLELEVSTHECDRALERVTELCGLRGTDADSMVEARRLFEAAKAIHGTPAVLKPLEERLQDIEKRLGLAGSRGVGVEGQPAEVRETQGHERATREDQSQGGAPGRARGPASAGPPGSSAGQSQGRNVTR